MTINFPTSAGGPQTIAVPLSQLTLNSSSAATSLNLSSAGAGAFNLVGNLDSTAASATATATATIVDNNGVSHTATLTLTQNADGSWTPSAQLAAGDTDTVSFGAPPPNITFFQGNASLPSLNMTLNDPDGNVTNTVSLSSLTLNSSSASTPLSATPTGTDTTNTWVVDGSVSGGTLSNNRLGTITFNSDGSLLSPATLAFTANFGPGASASQLITLNLGASGKFTGLTQFGSSSSAAAVSQNGYSSGVLSSVNIGQDGLIDGVFSNGNVIPIAQMAIANFANPAALTRQGNNLFSVSAASGTPLIGTGGTAGRGTVQQGTLEQSNVDVAQEMTELLMAERGYQVNADTVTVSDNVLQTLTNIIH